MHKVRQWIAAGAVCGWVFACGAPRLMAQSPSLERFNRQLEQIRQDNLQQPAKDVPIGQRALIDYGGYFTFDYLTVDDSQSNNHVLRQPDLTLYTRVNFDGAHELFLRARGTYQDFNKGDSFNGKGDQWINQEVVDRAYYKFDLARSQSVYHGKTLDYNVTAEVGRDLAYWGNGLTLGQVLDGATIGLTKGPGQFDFVAGVTPTKSVDFDSSRPNFDTNTHRGFYGGMLSTEITTQNLGTHRPFVYVLFQEDYNKDDALTVAPTTTNFNYNSHYIGVGSTGSLTDKLLYGAEFVYEGGETLSNSFEINPPFLTGVDQTSNDIEAYALDFRLDYLLNDPYRTRLSTELIVASGDDNRVLNSSTTFGGSAPGTKDRAFNGFGILYTGLAFTPSVSNLVVGRGGVSSFPLADFQMFRRLQVGTDVFVFGKTVDTAPIDETTRDNSYLGWEPDAFVNWQIVSDVTLAARYGVFFPSKDSFNSDEARQFFSIGLTIGF